MKPERKLDFFWLSSQIPCDIELIETIRDVLAGVVMPMRLGVYRFQLRIDIVMLWSAPALHQLMPPIPVHIQYPYCLQTHFDKESRQGAKRKGHYRRPSSKGARTGSDGPAGTARKAEDAKD